MTKALTDFTSTWPYIINADGWDIWNDHLYMKDEVSDWFDQNVKRDEWEYEDYFSLVGFKNETDAMMFKLRWQEGN